MWRKNSLNRAVFVTRMGFSMKKLNVAFLVIAVVAIAVGCTPTPKADTPPVAQPGKKVKIAVVPIGPSDFATIAQKGTEKAQKELGEGYQVDFKMLAEGSASEQKQVVETLIADGYQGLAISLVAPKDQVEMVNGAASKMAVVTQDSDAPDSNRLCYVGTDNVAAGHEAGKAIKEALPNGGKIMLFVGKKDAQNAQERAKGIADELKGSNVTILDIRTDDIDRVRAKANVADTLVKTPDISCLVGLWSYNGPAILSAVKDAKKEGKVKIVCFDEEDDTLAGVKAGEIYATVVQQPFEFGYQSVMLLSKVISGDKTSIPSGKKKIIATKTIKEDNVDAFKSELDVLRGRKK